ncbi:hypothetical protein M422DRAFT_265347 [Sphaerobolus stellatus SS14]|uniref:Uncharacterized protein n=1 Tax=Sphaerobolus stellatus (strain SS14) TaxID=990650 RepID=A0A0C9UUB6_SPHS4|nr:hypothetical protein M422DRAFT_265347 [Sphaerobolus stellatus SS14]
MTSPQLDALFQYLFNDKEAKTQQFIAPQQKEFFSIQVPQLVDSTEEDSPKDDKRPLTPDVAHAKDGFDSNLRLFTTSTDTHTGSPSNVLGLQLYGSTDSSHLSTYNNAIEESIVAVGNDCTSSKLSFDAHLPNVILGSAVGAEAALQAPSMGVSQRIGVPEPVIADDFDPFAFPAATFVVPHAPAVAASSTVSQPSPAPAVAPSKRVTSPKKRPSPYFVELRNSAARHAYPTPPTNIFPNLEHAQYPRMSGSGLYPPFGGLEGNNSGFSDANTFTFGPVPNGEPAGFPPLSPSILCSHCFLPSPYPTFGSFALFPSFAYFPSFASFPSSFSSPRSFGIRCVPATSASYPAPYPFLGLPTPAFPPAPPVSVELALSRDGRFGVQGVREARIC